MGSFCFPWFKCFLFIMSSSQFPKRSCSCGVAEARQCAGNHQGISFSLQLFHGELICVAHTAQLLAATPPGESHYVHACGASTKRKGKACGEETQAEAESPQGCHKELPYPGAHCVAEFWCSQLSFLRGDTASNSLSFRFFLFSSTLKNQKRTGCHRLLFLTES